MDTKKEKKMARINSKRDVVNYATVLGYAVAKQKMNRSSVDGLIESYVDRPGFYQSERPELIETGIAIVDNFVKNNNSKNTNKNQRTQKC